jgi:hypothetical protein
MGVTGEAGDATLAVWVWANPRHAVERDRISAAADKLSTPWRRDPARWELVEAHERLTSMGSQEAAARWLTACPAGRAEAGWDRVEGRRRTVSMKKARRQLPYQFNKYTPDELEECGRTFVQFLLDNRDTLFQLEGKEWTEVVLDWFSGTARSGTLVDAHPPKDAVTTELEQIRQKVAKRTTVSEFMVDLCHSNFPPYTPHPFYGRAYWSVSLSEPREIHLALESEWGKANNAQANYAFVMEDATKLSAIRAKCKVLVFATASTEYREEVLAGVKSLRQVMSDATPWLLVDGARSDWGKGKVQPYYLVIR